jgi:hypothetical protein
LYKILREKDGNNKKENITLENERIKNWMGR